MNRVELQQLAELRAVDAQALLVAQRWPAAYYIAGYAVECGLKACVLAYLLQKPDVIFDQKKFSEKCWTHNLEDLVELANLKTARDQNATASLAFGQNWQSAKDWSPESRYRQMSENEARKLVDAIMDVNNGVLQWIRAHW